MSHYTIYVSVSGHSLSGGLHSLRMSVHSLSVSVSVLLEYRRKLVNFLIKTFSSCYLCYFWIKNVVSNSN